MGDFNNRLQELSSRLHDLEHEITRLADALSAERERGLRLGGLHYKADNAVRATDKKLREHLQGVGFDPGLSEALEMNQYAARLFELTTEQWNAHQADLVRIQAELRAAEEARNDTILAMQDIARPGGEHRRSFGIDMSRLPGSRLILVRPPFRDGTILSQASRTSAVPVEDLGRQFTGDTRVEITTLDYAFLELIISGARVDSQLLAASGIKSLRVMDNIHTVETVEMLASATSLEELDISIRSNGQESRGYGILRPLSQLRNLRVLWIVGGSQGTVDISPLAQLPSVHELEILNVDPDEEWSRTFREMRSLRVLSIGGMSIPRSMLDALEALPLRRLSLANVRSTRPLSEFIQRCVRLERLDLYDMPGLRASAKKLPHLTVGGYDEEIDPAMMWHPLMDEEDWDLM